MAGSGAVGGRSRNLILAAMIFAVAMTFIDQTIVSIAVPQIQRELGLSSTGVQWAVNAYLLSLAALFAFGGRLADTVGHRKMVTLGVIVFAAASALCGLTPKGSLAEAWIVTFRVVQGAGGAIMFPAALAIVVQTFALRERGKALALFFGIAGGLTAIGPILGGYLTQWTWRAIFWVNIPVALIALVLIVISKPVTEHRPARMDYRGLVLIAAGVALSRVRLPAVQHLGLAQPGHLAVHRRRPGPAGRVLLRRAAHRVAADPGEHLPHPAVPGREPGARHLDAGVHPGVLLRQRVRADLRWARRRRNAGALPALLLHRLRDRRADRRPDARQARGQAAGGARLRAGRGRVLPVGREGHRARASAPSSGTSSCPAPAWGSCSARPAPTR